MRRLLVALLVLTVPQAAHAAGGALRQQMLQAPGWVQQGAVADLDFVNGRYWVRGMGLIGPSRLVPMIRNSTKTNLLPTSPSGAAYTTYQNNQHSIVRGLGILIEEGRTNQLLNSTAPATQTTGSLANATYTLWVNGSGTATMSSGTATGCGTGVASQGTPVTFTTTGTAGTCTVTVSGLLNAFQLEAGTSGSTPPTSLIVTAGATVARASDQVNFGTAMMIPVSLSQGTMVVSSAGLPGGASQSFATWMGMTTRAIIYQNGTTTTSIGSNDTSNLNAMTATLGGSTTTATPFKAALSWDGGNRSLVGNYGTVVTNAHSMINAAPTAGVLGRSGSTGFINTYLWRYTVWNQRLSDGALKELTR